MRQSILILTALSLSASLFAQQPAAAPAKKKTEAALPAKPQGLTVDSIVSMVQAGLSEDLIVTRIRKEEKAFDLSPEDMIKLKKSGVSDSILQVMLDPKAEINRPTPTAPTPPPAEPTQPPASATPAEPPKKAPETASSPAVPADPGALTGGVKPFTEVGVYYKKAGEWMEMLPEVVNWRTGGVLKTIASAGIVKQDINGHIPGPHSRNSLALPAEFMIYTAEGVAITEYQLLRLRAKRDYREFRTITGGVLHQKSGAMRDMVPFEGKKVGNRLFSVILPSNLGAGDYGFIWLGGAGSAGGLTSLSMGKMYTFRVVE
jgi:hypothetical protein